MGMVTCFRTNAAPAGASQRRATPTPPTAGLHLHSSALGLLCVMVGGPIAVPTRVFPFATTLNVSDATVIAPPLLLPRILWGGGGRIQRNGQVWC